MTASNDAAFVEQTVPSTMCVGQVAAVTVKMRNTGGSIWNAADNYRLGAQKPSQDSDRWGNTRAYLVPYINYWNGGVDTATFNSPGSTWNVVPNAAGTYEFQWQMVRDGVGWFGQKTNSVSVTVLAVPSSAPSLTQPAYNQKFPPGTSSVTLKWSSVDGATSYDVRVTDDNDAADTSNIVGANSNCAPSLDVCYDGWTNREMTITVQSGKRYKWWVHAKNQCGSGGGSANYEFLVDTNSPPAASIASGASAGCSGTAYTYAASGSDVNSNLYDIALYVSPTSSRSATLMGECSFADTSSYNCQKSWTPSGAGAYYVFVNAWDRAGGQCSGNPWCDFDGGSLSCDAGSNCVYCTGWSRCGSSDRTTVTISSNECSAAGVIECSSNQARTCGSNYDGDPCLEWSSYTSCGSTQSCASGYSGSCANSCSTASGCVSCTLTYTGSSPTCCGNDGTSVGSSGTCCSNLVKCDGVCRSRSSCSCDDGNACTTGDTIQADGVCRGTAYAASGTPCGTTACGWNQVGSGCTRYCNGAGTCNSCPPSCTASFGTSIESVCVNNVCSGDVSVPTTGTITAEITVKNTGAFSQAWWFVGAEAMRVGNYNDPYNSRYGTSLITKYYNGKDDYGDCTVSDASDIPSGGTRKITCTFPAASFGATSGIERVMFWVHERDLGQDRNGGCAVWDGSSDTYYKTCGNAVNCYSATPVSLSCDQRYYSLRNELLSQYGQCWQYGQNVCNELQEWIESLDKCYSQADCDLFRNHARYSCDPNRIPIPSYVCDKMQLYDQRCYRSRSNGCWGGSWWDDALATAAPAAVRVSLIDCTGSGGATGPGGYCCSGLTKCSGDVCRSICTGDSCNDGSLCTFNDRIQADGSCRGTIHSCPDVKCGRFVCDGNGGCTGSYVSVWCTDDNACTAGDFCSEGSCRATAYTCPPQSCPADSCASSTWYSTWYDYPASCTRSCLGNGACSVCDCTAQTTACTAGSGCCVARCSAGSGCSTAAGSCADLCSANTLTIGQSCSGCGANGAAGNCGGGTSYTCDATSHTLCQQYSCGGSTYSCTNAGGSWSWRTATGCNDNNACTYNDACASGSCRGTSYACSDVCTMNTLTIGRGCNGDGTCGSGTSYACDATTYTSGQQLTCGGLQKCCTYASGSWQWSSSCDSNAPSSGWTGSSFGAYDNDGTASATVSCADSGSGPKDAWVAKKVNNAWQYYCADGTWQTDSDCNSHNGIGFLSSTYACTSTGADGHRLQCAVRCRDNALNVDASWDYTTDSLVDTSAPTSGWTSSTFGTYDTDGSASAVTSCSDSGSGIRDVYVAWRVNGLFANYGYQAYPYTCTSTGSNGQYIQCAVRCRDNAGNLDDSWDYTAGTIVDTAPPSTSSSSSVTANQYNWYTSNVAVTLACSDTGGSGCGATKYCTDTAGTCTPTTTYSAAVTISSREPCSSTRPRHPAFRYRIPTAIGQQQPYP
ncbi:MAG: hypothetical protein HYY37_01185 [Candidatus Aenigmarchaeota archaeon]|nr:hypothetical protein [Candidatus Aenigmarchaeota archaeon]